MGDCDVAIVGGVSLSIPQNGGYIYKEGGPLSADGVCRPFDQDANGTVPGDACTVVVLKRLKAAQADRDRIYAVITGTAVNNDGADKIGFAAPSISGQCAVIREALSYANLGPEQVDYIEAHGTGTILGDRIELAALSETFMDHPGRLPIGSTKGNVGHGDVVSGLTSLTKAVHMLRSGVVPPVANLRMHRYDENGLDAQFEFPAHLITRELKNIGVSSFGLGGTNSHAILTRYVEEIELLRCPLAHYLIPISVNRLVDLPRYIESILWALEGDVDFLDFAVTLAVGRRRRAEMFCIVVANRADFIAKLQSLPISCVARKTPNWAEWTPDDIKNLHGLLPSFAESARPVLPDKATNEEWQATLSKYLTELSIRLNHERFRYHGGPENDIRTSAARARGKNEDVLERFFKEVAAVHAASSVDLSTLYAKTGARRVALPPYPLSEKSYWFQGASEGRLAPCGNAALTESPKPRSVERRVLPNREAFLTDVIRIWADVIGPEEITPDTTFSETSADSISAIEIIHNLKKAFGIHLSALDFLSRLTPRQIVERILQAPSNSEKPERDDCVTMVRETGYPDQKTFFLIHPAGGSTFCYGAMNRFLSGPYNVCAIDLPDEYTGYSSMEQLGAHYLDIIRREQSRGPYYIGGYSFGGNMSFEIAGQMAREDLQVGAIIMFDSHPPEAYQEEDPIEIDYEPICSKVLLEFLDFGPLLRQADPLDVKDFCERWSHCFRLLKAHRPTHCADVDLVLFAATKHECEDVIRELNMRDVDKAAWQKYFRGEIQVVRVGGDHYSMFGETYHLRKLAKAFDAWATGVTPTQCHSRVCSTPSAIIHAPPPRRGWR